MTEPENQMSSKQVLEGILLMLRTFSDDKSRLENLYRYMDQELYKPLPDPETELPERYKPLCKEVAEYLDCQMICHVNPETLEIVPVPVVGSAYWDSEDESNEDPGPIYFEWARTITIEPPESHERFRYMEQFVEELSDTRLKQALQHALTNRKPFRHFNNIIHQSTASREWFAFKDQCLESYVADVLLGNLADAGE